MLFRTARLRLALLHERATLLADYHRVIGF